MFFIIMFFNLSKRQHRVVDRVASEKRQRVETAREATAKKGENPPNKLWPLDSATCP